jgi:hypothetical protein
VKGRSLVVVGLWLGSATLAQAQIIQGPGIRTRGPLAWTSLGIGWMQLGGLVDGESNATWDFGSAPQWRASLEFPLGRGASIGGMATTARVPLIYSGGLGANSCVSCDADANVSQFMATLHIGGGSGFHQVIDVSAGTTVFSNFRSTGGTKLGGKAVTDWTFGIGYGFGYSLSDRMSIMIVQDYGLIIHKRQSGSTNNTAQQSTLRIGARYGLGG